VRKTLTIAGAVALLVAIPAAVIAANGVFGGALDRQAGAWTTTSASTSSTDWRNVPRLKLSRCTRNQVTAMLSVTLSGAPVQFRAIIDGVPEAPMQPGTARFDPQGTESFAYNFVGPTAPFEADDTHSFAVQWRSPTGNQVTMQRGALNLLFQNGTQGC
jgi:hypothetical protein